MWPTLVKGENGTCLKFSIEHGTYNELEERGRSWRLVLTESEFAIAVKASVECWLSVELPKVFRPLPEIMAGVDLSREVQGAAFNASVPIPLCEESVVRHTYRGATVLLPLKTFVLGAITHLAESPILKLSGFSWDFWEGFRQAWAATIEAASQTADPRVVHVGF